MKIRATRSDQYQYKLLEIPVDFSQYQIIAEEQYDIEIYKELQEQLLKRIFELIDINFNEKEKLIMSYYLQNLTQADIAKKLKLTQSTIYKHLFGAEKRFVDKKTKRKTQSYASGGMIGKLKILIDNDEEMQIILNDINDVIS